MEGLDLLGALSLSNLRLPALAPALPPHEPLTPAAAAVAATRLLKLPPVSKAITTAAASALTATSPAIAKAQRQLDASKRALIVASRLTGHLAPHGAKLTTKANRAMADAQRTLSAASHRAMGAMQNGTTKYGGGSAGGGGGGSSGGTVAAAPPGGGSAGPPTDDSGVDINVLNAVSQVVTTANMMQVVLDALSAGGTIQAALAAEAKAAHSVMGALIGGKYATAIGFAIADVVTQGQAIIQRALNVVDNYDPANPDQSIPGTVAAINKDATTWNSDINQLVHTTPTATTTGPGATAAGAPTITSIVDQASGTPSSGSPGDTVAITGTNFSGVSAVLFGGVPAVPFTIISPTQMTALVPQAAVTGNVQVTNSAGTGVSTTPFTVAPSAAQPPAGGGGGYSGGGGGGGGGFDGGGADPSDDSGVAADEEDYDDSGQPTGDPANVMQDPYGAYEDNYGVDNDGTIDDGSDDTSGDDAGDVSEDDGGDLALVGGGHGGGHGGGGHGHNGHRGGARGGWYAGPMFDVDGLELIDAVDVDEPDREQVVDDIVEEVTRRLQDKTLVGAYDIQSAQRQMNTLKQVTVAIARAMVKGGQNVASETISMAEGGWLQKELPGITSLKNTQGHLQWHADALSKLSDPTAIYSSGDDLKKWAMQAFIDSDAVEEGRARQEQIWQDMWTEIGAALAALPLNIAKTIMSIPGKAFEGLTGIPSWVFWVGGAAVVVLLGFGVWKILMAAAPAAGHVVASRYLP